MSSREACRESAEAEAGSMVSPAGVCPVCGAAGVRSFFEASGVPVHIGVQWPSAADAIACRKGDITLAACPSCGFITNTCFDARLMAYEGVYENSLHFSPLFQEYAQELADHLIATYTLREKDIIEIGCGHGEFLNLLCELGGNRGVGFDPGMPPEQASNSEGRVEFVKGEFSLADASRPMDLVCCRQVLEHISDPVSFLRIVREAIGDRMGAIAFFEVPDFIYALNTLSIWDIIYEHCSYFGPSSLKRTFIAAGFEPLNLRSYYGDTFIGIEAKPATRDAAAGDADPPDPPLSTDAIAEFESAWRKKTEAWETRLDGFAGSGRRAVLWGAGARAVSFLNMLGVAPDGVIDRVVDLNPRKHGLHLAGTGHLIVAPDSLPALPPDVVILTNAMYEREIAKSLADMGLHPEILLA